MKLKESGKTGVAFCQGFILAGIRTVNRRGYKSQVLPFQTTCWVIAQIKQTPLYLKIKIIRLHLFHCLLQEALSRSTRVIAHLV